MIQTEPLERFTQRLPQGWRTVAFSELLAEPVKNGVYKPKEFHGMGAKVVNMGELFAYDFINGQEMKRVQLDDREASKYLLQPGDLLFARRSLVLEGSGKCSLVIAAVEPTTFESSIIRARPNPDEADSRFLLYLFQSPLGRAIMAAISTRTAVSGIRASDLADVGLPVPPLDEQRRIAGILSAYDDLIENCQRRIRILEEMARRLYREWFVHFRYPGHESIPLVDSPLGPIPQGWEVKALSEVAVVHRGRSYRSDELADEGGVPFLNLKCLDRDGGFRRSGIKCFTGKAKAEHWARKGDIVMAVTDMTQERRIVARAARVPTLEGGQAVFSMDLVRIEPLPLVHKDFVYAFLRFSGFADEVKNHANGANVLHLSPDRIRDHTSAWPPTEHANRAGSFFSAVLEAIDNLENQAANLRRTRDLLLPRLLHGGET